MTESNGNSFDGAAPPDLPPPREPWFYRPQMPR
jgi:hypothetical protein